MNSNTDYPDPLARINRLLDPINEENVEESLGGTGSQSLRNFARETALVINQQGTDHFRHDPQESVDLRDFPNSDFYYKLVAKVSGKYYSIYDGKTEYVIGS